MVPVLVLVVLELLLVPRLPHKFNLKLVFIASIQWSECECALIPQIMCIGTEADEIEYFVDTDIGMIKEWEDLTFPSLDLIISPIETFKRRQNLAVSCDFRGSLLESIL